MFGPSVKKVQRWKNDRNVDALVKAMDSNDYDIKVATIDALADLQHKTSAKLIINALRHPISSTVRESAAKALGTLKANLAIKDLIKTLGDDHPKVQAAAKQALLSMGATVYPIVRDQLSDFYHETIRNTCRDILVKAGARATDVLIDGLEKGTYGIREESALLLGELGDSRSREALVHALADNRIEVRKASAGALKAIGWHPGSDHYAVHYYVAIGEVESAIQFGEMAQDPLKSWLIDDDMDLRRRVAIGLRRLDWRPTTRKEAADFWAAAGKFSELVKLGPDAVDTLVRMVGDKNLKVKKGAAKVLTRIGVPPQVKQLVKDINMMVDFTVFKLSDGTFNLDTIALEGASHYRGKYYLLRVENCDSQQTKHIQKLYPAAEIISEDEARSV